MKASLKRIIWALGWQICWTFNDIYLFIKNGNITSNSNNTYQWFMLLVWIIPLLYFKDDKENKRR